MDSEKIPSRFNKTQTPPDSQSPAGASGPQVESSASADGVELVTVRWQNGNAYHYAAGTIVEDDSAYRIYRNNPAKYHANERDAKAGLVAIVSKHGRFVLETCDPYAVEIRSELSDTPPDTGTEGTRGGLSAKPGFWARLFGSKESQGLPPNLPPPAPQRPK